MKNKICENFKSILDEYINNRQSLECAMYPADVVVYNADNTITMTITKLPKDYAWYVESDVMSVLLEAMSQYIKRHKCNDVDLDEMWDLFEETYDYEWDINVYDNLCDNILKVIKK